MQPYYTNEVRFLIPDRCVDRTVNAFIIPRGKLGEPVDPDDTGEFSLVITRVPIAPEMSLSTYLDRQLEAVSEMLREFRLLSRRPTSVDNRPAEQVDFSWRSEESLMRQQQTHFQYGSVVVTVTGTAVDLDFDKHRAALAEMLATMKAN
jgi:hypothetical protein